MDLTGIISVSGNSGLHKVVAQTRGGLLVESLADGKRIPVYSSNKVSALSDISIYGKSEDIPLKDILKAIGDKTGSQPVPDFKSDQSSLVKAFGEYIPEFDAVRVYVSDMKKVMVWYNLLLAKNLLIDQEEEEAPKGDEKLKTDAAVSKVATKTKSVQKTAAPKALSKGMAKTQTVRKTGG